MLNIWTSNSFKIGPAKTPAGWNYYRKQSHGIQQTPAGFAGAFTNFIATIILPRWG
jgi:hypothetical protein